LAKLAIEGDIAAAKTVLDRTPNRPHTKNRSLLTTYSIQMNEPSNKLGPLEPVPGYQKRTSELAARELHCAARALLETADFEPEQVEAWRQEILSSCFRMLQYLRLFKPDQDVFKPCKGE